MRAFVVVELDPVADCSGRVREAFEALPVDALFLQRSDQALHHTVLLRRMGRDELLTQAIAFDQGRVLPRREDEAVVAAKQERFIDFAQCAKACNQGVLQS